ncbi:hypothetical protein FAZ69_19590 [Trinickia terrae]|uniref:Uncharacterized protein n=2 Tax=Trinickia terrae TaxID=2571161 RepID=A0A4U1I1J3_9BURK|nr:hypothetical protein FAZ69_19590 [Trinickia terrae]
MPSHAASCNSRSFADYPAASGNAQPQAATHPVLTSKKAQLFRTVIRNEFSEPANFAGHYRVAIWGCGTDCRDFAILDKDTGSVYTMPGESEVNGVMGNDDERINFRMDSKLFIISGCFNENESCLNKPEKLFYEWTGKTLRLIGRCRLDVESVN